MQSDTVTKTVDIVVPTRRHKEGIQGMTVDLEGLLLLFWRKCAENTLVKCRRQECPSFPIDMLSFNSLKEYYHI
jgi:hypothetical protein